jgi:hypothetical protein
MTTLALWDGLVVGWQMVLFAVSLLCAIIVAPWIAGINHRLRGLKSPGVLSRIAAGAAGLVFLVLLLPALVGWFGLACNARDAGQLAVVFIMLLLVLGSFAVLWMTVPRWPLRWRGIKLPITVVVMSGVLVYLVGLASLNRIRGFHMRAIDGSSLHSIGQALALYYHEHNQFPDDLRRLIDEGQGVNAFFPASDRRHGRITTHPYEGPVGFQYVTLPSEPPGNLLWVWESPKFYKWEGTNVLYSDCSVRWVTPEKLLEDLTRTYEWLLANRTQGTTRPSEK